MAYRIYKNSIRLGDKSSDLSVLSGAQALRYTIVTELPTSGEAGVIYLLKDPLGSTINEYREYIYILENHNFEQIGSSADSALTDKVIKTDDTLVLNAGDHTNIDLEGED